MADYYPPDAGPSPASGSNKQKQMSHQNKVTKKQLWIFMRHTEDYDFMDNFRGKGLIDYMFRLLNDGERLKKYSSFGKFKRTKK